MLRFLSHNWPKLGVLAIFYVIAAVGLSFLTNAQIDTVKGQTDALQFVDHRMTDY
jgi:hypothetical protein